MWIAWETFKEPQVQSTSEAERQKRYYDTNANAISLEPGDLVISKADAYGGKMKVKDWWEEELYEVECQVAEGFLPHEEPADRMLRSPPLKKTFSYCSYRLLTGTPLSMVMQAKWARCTTNTEEELTPEGSETEEVPQSANCPSPAQHQTGKTPLGWVNRKLCAFLWTFPGASLLDQGWKVQCRGIRSVWKLPSVFWLQRYWLHQWGSNDMTVHNNFDPTSLWSRDCMLITLGVWNGGISPCINFWGDYFALNTDAVRMSGISHARDPYQCYPVKWIEKSCSKS